MRVDHLAYAATQGINIIWVTIMLTPRERREQVPFPNDAWFPISYSHTEWYSLFPDSATTSAQCVFGAKKYISALVNPLWNDNRWPH